MRYHIKKEVEQDLLREITMQKTTHEPHISHKKSVIQFVPVGVAPSLRTSNPRFCTIQSADDDDDDVAATGSVGLDRTIEDGRRVAPRLVATCFDSRGWANARVGSQAREVRNREVANNMMAYDSTERFVWIMTL